MGIADETLLEAIPARHSVRTYTGQAIPEGVRAQLDECIAEANERGNLHIQAAYDEPSAFSSMLAHYGKFSGVANYLVIAGQKASDLEERAGFWGERIVLAAQTLRLNTCWVGLTYGKSAAKRLIAPSEKLVIVVATGYGQTQGAERKSKPVEELADAANGGPLPAWFAQAMSSVQLAPTAMNQQKFLFELDTEGGSGAKSTVSAKSLGGFFSKVDLGIAKCHFELAANATGADWRWA